MSGNTKRILYIAAESILRLASVAGVVLLLLFKVPRPIGTPVWLIFLAWVLCLVLRIPAVVHEFGHLLFGWIAGMKCASITFSYFKFGRGKIRLVLPDAAGSCAMYPKNGKNVRGKTIFFTIGGSAVCLAVGGALLLLCLLLPYYLGTLFCGSLGLSVLCEGLIALCPALLPAGKTDGAVLLGLIRRAPEEEVMFRVLTAQGVLYRGRYSDLEEGLLFSAPVVREDLPAFHALLLLQYYYLKEKGDEEGAGEKIARLRSLAEYLSDEEREELDKIEA